MSGPVRIRYLIPMTKPKIEVGRWDDRDPYKEQDPRGASIPVTPLSHLEALAWILDSSILVPGLPFRIGVESLLGLIPVIGDAIGALLSTYILVMAARMGVPRVTLLRMGYNITLEAVVGVVPLVGDLFDFAWKANRRNVELLRTHMEDPRRAHREDWLFAALFVLGVAGALFLLGWGGYALGKGLLNGLRYR